MAKRIIAIMLILMLTISMAACGNDSSETSGEKELAQGVSEDNVKIGTVAVQSGPLSFIGAPYVAGMEAYFKTINKDGGVNGREIELLKKDDEFKPDKSVQAIESLIFDEEVFAVVGHLGTPGVVASEEIIKEEGIPSVYFGSGAASLTEAGENFFPVQPNYLYEGKLMSKFAVEEFNAEDVVVIYQNDDVGNDGLEGFKTGLDELDKKDILKAEIPFGASDTDFTVPIQKAKEQDPDLIIIYGLSTGAAGILKNMENAGMTDVDSLTTYSNADASFLEVAAPAAEKAIKNLHVMGWLEVTEESLQPLMDAMKEYYPDTPINSYTMAGWVAGETFVAGLKKAEDNLSWDGYIEAMNGLNYTEGLASEISYSEGEREGVTQMAVSEVVEENGSYQFKQMTDFMEFK
ncbi:ABC transporter substrate-binding protein [Senegalia massiliensis]|uniref:ABC transporter substrate-binding protein n=1 Tax=Senegalia massiliensis TaxID=1720316 RepID=A0A845R1R1_9CLOT|nr:ABC transporter substrate-binding protein [Senegalia massiliensis]NBI07468.1 ABC transporter substrate-binding protein [Senegalia massiliensis]